MSTMLHLINKSPFDGPALDSCLRLAKAGSAVLLFEDGVYAAMHKAASAAGIRTRLGDLKIYVLGPDLAARGLQDTPLIDGIEAVDYAGFVDLVVEHKATQSWM